VVSRRIPHKSLFTSPALLKSLSGDAEVAGTARYFLAMRTKRGNSCTCCFYHIRGPLRGSVTVKDSRGTFCVLTGWFLNGVLAGARDLRLPVSPSPTVALPFLRFVGISLGTHGVDSPRVLFEKKSFFQFCFFF